MRVTHIRFSAGCSILLGLMGCQGQIGGTPSPAGGRPAEATAVRPEDAGSPGLGNADKQLCTGEPDVARSPLRRLTREEYRRAVRDIFGVEATVDGVLAPDERVGGIFASNAEGSVTSLHAQQYLASAEQVAREVQLPNILDCDGSDDDEEVCVEHFIERVGRRVYRRPLTPAERDAYGETYQELRGTDDLETTMRVLVQALLQSPHFLYHLELADPDAKEAEGTVARLPAFALASRLSFLLWGSVPDDALLDAAEAGELDEDEEVLAQADRLLDDPKAAETLDAFHGQWLGVQDLEDAVRDETLFPEWSPELVQAVQKELGRYADYMIREQGADVRELLTAPVSLPVGPGIDLLADDEVEQQRDDGVFELNPEIRAGLLTQSAFLASHSHSDQTSPILRGLAVRERLFCHSLPDPPPSVVAQPPELDEGLTTRERFALHRTTGSACAGCHVLIDDLGFALEHFDALGRYREKEHSRDIDATGTIEQTDVDGKIDGAVALAQRLGDSEQVRDCYATQWFRYALGRTEQPADECSVRDLHDTLDSDGRIVDLLRTLATSDAFLHYRVEE